MSYSKPLNIINQKNVGRLQMPKSKSLKSVSLNYNNDGNLKNNQFIKKQIILIV
jgi:hypothetical protein